MNMKSLLPSLWGEDEKDPFKALQREMDKLFEDFSSHFHLPSAIREKGGMALRPSLDVSETDEVLTVTAELPGVEEKDINVSLGENLLTIKGEKKAKSEDVKEEEERRYHRVERSYGAFVRTIPIPFAADAEKVKAEFRNGVLTVTLPKPPETDSKAQRIKIKPAG